MAVKLIEPDAEDFFARVIQRQKNYAIDCQHDANAVREITKNIEIFERLQVAAEDHSGKAYHLDFDDSEVGRILFKRKIMGRVFLCMNGVYDVVGPYDIQEAGAVLTKYLQRKKRDAQSLVARRDVPESEQDYERRPISEEVRHEVWRRDSGRCVKCGSVHNLEFDHIIPVSKGGSNTARNIQLLCETCNRQKSAQIG